MSDDTTSEISEYRELMDAMKLASKNAATPLERDVFDLAIGALMHVGMKESIRGRSQAELAVLMLRRGFTRDAEVLKSVAEGRSLRLFEP